LLCQLTYSLLHYVTGIADDSTGKLWALVSDPQRPKLMAFAHGSDGADPPVQTITGKHTLLYGATEDQFIGVDGANNVWVANPTGYVEAFRSNAHGDAKPLVTIGYGDKGHNEHLPWPIAVAFDSKGNLYVANYTLPGTITVFKPPFFDSETPAAVWTLQNVNPESIAADAHDNVYLGTQDQLYVFKHGLASGGTPSYYMGLAIGDHGHSYDTVADPSGRVFVALLAGGPSCQNGIAVLPRNARSIEDAQFLTGSVFSGPPNALAVGL
jgi:hypothetical protein